MSSIVSQSLSPKTISKVFPANKEYFFNCKSHYKRETKYSLFFFFRMMHIYVCLCWKIITFKNMDIVDIEFHYLVGKRKLFILGNLLNLEIYVSKSKKTYYKFIQPGRKITQTQIKISTFVKKMT